MDVDDPDLDALASATCSQLRARELGKIKAFRARELGKIKAFIPNPWPNAPVPESIGISSQDNAPRESRCGASSHEQSDSDESREDLEKSIEWILKGYLFFNSDGCRTDETYEAEIRAVVD